MTVQGERELMTTSEFLAMVSRDLFEEKGFVQGGSEQSEIRARSDEFLHSGFFLFGRYHGDSNDDWLDE